MHAVPIQTSAMIHIPVRAGGGKKSAATMAAFGIHHANAFVRGLLSQSCELWTISFAMMAMWHSAKRRPSHPTTRPGSAGTEPSRRNRTRNKRLNRLRRASKPDRAKHDDEQRRHATYRSEDGADLHRS